MFSTNFERDITMTIEQFEDTKVVIKSRNTKKDKQCNGQNHVLYSSKYMFLEFLSHYNTIVSHMIKHTSLCFLYGTI